MHFSIIRQRTHTHFNAPTFPNSYISYTLMITTDVSHFYNQKSLLQFEIQINKNQTKNCIHRLVDMVLFIIWNTCCSTVLKWMVVMLPVTLHCMFVPLTTKKLALECYYFVVPIVQHSITPIKHLIRYKPLSLFSAF